jgi:hypothetical protein
VNRALRCSFIASVEFAPLPFRLKSNIIFPQGSRVLLVKRDPLQIWAAERVRELAQLGVNARAKIDRVEILM